MYGIVTHTGFSLLSGHYIAYVKAPRGAKPSRPLGSEGSVNSGGDGLNTFNHETTHKTSENETSINDNNNESESKYADCNGISERKTCETSLNNNNNNNGNEGVAQNKDNTESDSNESCNDNVKNGNGSFKSECCPMDIESPDETTLPQDEVMADPNNNADSNNNLDNSGSDIYEKRAENCVDEAKVTNESDGQALEELWYECDDEIITEMTRESFKQVLAPGSSNVPYMLFYKQMEA